MENSELRITEHIDYETFVHIISNIPSCIFFKNTELKYIFSSHFWSQLNSEDIYGKTDIDIRKDTDNAIKAMDADKEIIRTKKGCKYIIKSDIDGDVSYLELIKEPIMDVNNDVIGIVGLINDVTEKTIMEKKIVGMSEMLEVQCKELETSNDELKAMLEKVEKMHTAQKMFTASMNHELRSPLNSIIGSLQLLMEDKGLNDEQHENIKNAFLSSQLMLELVNELLDFAKLETSGFKIKRESFKLSAITNNIEYGAKTQAKSKGLDFTLIKDENMQDDYVGDAKRITQIMHNFVSNALKYTDEGSVSLKVSYENGMLVIACSDTGQGIAEESLGCLFDPYVRFNEDKNANIQGTGLGLSVVKRIIDNMNGEIEVDSTLDVGSTFTARIPTDLVMESTEGQQVDNTVADKKKIDYSKLKILCVDDSKVNAMVMVAQLNKLGIRAESASSANEGIIKADMWKYDIIFMDHMMPEMDGLEAFSIIRKKSLKNSRTPVVMLTGNAEESYADLYKQHGLDGYLVKPTLRENLIDIIDKVL